MNILVAIYVRYYPTGSTYIFIRKNTAGVYRNHSYYVSDLSQPSVNRVNHILSGTLVKRIGEGVDHNYAHVEYKIRMRPGEVERGVYINLDGDMVVTLSPRDRVELRREVRDESGEYNYYKMKISMYEMFAGGSLEFHDDASDSGIAMYGGPVILERVYYDESDPRYNGNDDDLGTDWAKSRVWFYNDYVFKHPVEDIIEQGYVVFNRHDEGEDE